MCICHQVYGHKKNFACPESIASTEGFRVEAFLGLSTSQWILWSAVQKSCYNSCAWHEICHKKSSSAFHFSDLLSGLQFRFLLLKFKWPAILENSPKPHLSPVWSSNSNFLLGVSEAFHPQEESSGGHYITTQDIGIKFAPRSVIESPHSTTLQDGPLVINRVVFHPYNWHDRCVTGVKQLLKTWS